MSGEEQDKKLESKAGPPELSRRFKEKMLEKGRICRRGTF